MNDSFWGAFFGFGQKSTKAPTGLEEAFPALAEALTQIVQSSQSSENLSSSSGEDGAPVAPVTLTPQSVSSNREIYHEDYFFGNNEDSLMNRYYYSRDQNGSSSYDSVNYNFYKKDGYGRK